MYEFNEPRTITLSVKEATEQLKKLYDDKDVIINLNPKLTADEIRALDGQKVWVVDDNGDVQPDWHTVYVGGDVLIDPDGMLWDIDEAVISVYRHKLEE